MLLPPLSKLPGYRPRYGYPDDVPELPGESLPGDFSAAHLDNREQGPIMPPPVPPAPRPEVESTGPQMLALNSPPQMPDPKAPLIGAKAFKTPQPPPVPPAPKVLPEPPAVDQGPPKPPQLALNLPPRFQPKAPVVSINAGQDEGIAPPAPDFNYSPQAFPKNGGAIPETKPLGSPMEQYQGLKRPMRPGYKLDDQGNVVDDPKTAPKWYQKLAAAALGAGAGWVNADGRAKIDPRQTAAAVEGIAAPGYAGKVAEYEGRKQELEDKTGMQLRQTQIEAAAEQKRALAAKYVQDQTDRESALDDKETRAQQDRQLKSFNAYVQNGKLPTIYRDASAPAIEGWEKVPIANPEAPKGMVAYIPPRMAPLPKELVPYAAGMYKEGQMVPRDELTKMTDSFRTATVNSEKPDTRQEKQGEAEWIAKMNDPKSTPAEREFYKANLASSAAQKVADRDPSMQAMHQLALATGALMLQTRKMEMDRLTAEHSPENVQSLANMVKNDPSMWFEKTLDEKGMRDIVGRQITASGGQIPSRKPSSEMDKMAVPAAVTVAHVNAILPMLNDPAIQKVLGPVEGRLAKGEELVGMNVPGATPEETAKIQKFLTNLNYLFFREGKALIGGRPPQKLMEELKKTSPGAQMTMARIKGAIDAVKQGADLAINERNNWIYGNTPGSAPKPGGGASGEVEWGRDANGRPIRLNK